MHVFATMKPEDVLERGKKAYAEVAARGVAVPAAAEVVSVVAGSGVRGG
jgi:hypothetical protein